MLHARFVSHGDAQGKQRRRKPNSLRRVAALSLATLGLTFATTPVQAAPLDTLTIPCRDVHIPVTVLGVPQTMYGKLCTPLGAKTVQVLIPGSSYNSTYWDFPQTPEIRSYRLAMNKAGYATFTLDRVGSGRSSRPLSITLTAFTQADTVHQAITALRKGTYGTKFEKVITGGHSLGSSIAIIEAATYNDVDGVLITGQTHRVNPLGVLPVFASLIPAELDLKFKGKGYELTYVTTMANSRPGLFHTPGRVVPEVSATEEATKDVFALTEVVDAVLIAVITPYSRKITAPVLVAMGNDPTSCGLLASDCSTAEGLHRGEAPYYSKAAKLSTFVLPSFGHSINYAPEAPKYHRAVIDWADEMVGSK